jgi:hypothetical protein
VIKLTSWVKKIFIGDPVKVRKKMSRVINSSAYETKKEM